MVDCKLHTAVKPFDPKPYNEFEQEMERCVPKTVCGDSKFPVSWNVVEDDPSDCGCEYEESDEDERLAVGLRICVKCVFDNLPEWKRFLCDIRGELQDAMEGAGLKLSKPVLDFRIKERPGLIPGATCISGFFKLADDTTFDIGQHRIVFYPKGWDAPPVLVVDLVKSYC